MTQATSPVTSSWKAEFGPQKLVPGLATGVLEGFMSTILAMAFASLIFVGPYTEFQTEAFGLALASAIIFGALTSLLSRLHGSVSIVQEVGAIVLSLAATHFATQLGDSQPETLLPTLLVMIGASTLLTGILLLVAGRYNLGVLVRFVPYPVVGGFLAGTGWLVVSGSFASMASYPLEPDHIPALLQPDQMQLWIPGVVMAVILYFGLKFIKHILALPGLLIALVALFYVGLALTGTTVAEAGEIGLLPQLSGDLAWRPLTPSVLAAVDWPSFFTELHHIPIIFAMVLLNLLLNLQGLETSMGEDIDTNRELEVAGITNIIAGLAGGLTGFTSVSTTTLNSRIGARSRLTGVVTSLVCLIILLAGSDVVGYFPRPVMGGLTLFLGFDLVEEWALKTYSRLSRSEYLVLLLILVVIVTVGLVVGIAVGLVTMVIMFSINYSRMKGVRHELTGRDMHSNVRRPAVHREALDRHGAEIRIFELQGFIFFGTANALYERIRHAVREPDETPLRFAVLDFRHVIGLDSSAVYNFTKVRLLAQTNGFEMALAGAKPDVLRQLKRGGLGETGDTVSYYTDLDHALEWAENRIIERELSSVDLPTQITQQLEGSRLDKAIVAGLMPYLDRQELAPGDYLFQQGDAPDVMVFIESGQVSVYLQLDGDRTLRLRTAGRGTVVGEIGFYLDTQRTASIMADQPCVVYRLTAASVDKLKGDNPTLYIAFSEFLTRLLAERLASLNQTLDVLNR